MTPTTVIVGSSIGGVRTAQALRAEGYTGEVVLIGEESILPYDKPPLSKSVLAGTATAESIALLTEQEAEEASIRLELGRAATHLDVAAKQLELAGGTRMHFDDVVIATGARGRPSPWGQPDGVHVLRTLDDAVALRADLRCGGPLVVIGAGFIGAEVAATARDMAVDEVVVVDPLPVPLGRVLDTSVAKMFSRLHQDHGVTTRFGVGVSDIRPVGGGIEVLLSDGAVLAAATVVVGIGAVPNDDWLGDSGLEVDCGVVCDQYSRAVDAPHVYAVGDVARWHHPRYGRLNRVEHWTNAVQQASCVAHNITHPVDLQTHDPIEYVWSDQYDWKIQLAGRTGGDLEHITVEGPGPGRSFAVLYVDPGGRFTGALTVNWPRALVACRRALATSTTMHAVREIIVEAAKRASPTVSAE